MVVAAASAALAAPMAPPERAPLAAPVATLASPGWPAPTASAATPSMAPAAVTAARANYQLSQCVRLSAGNRLAGRKSVPLV
ncbi:hypothetical protein MSIMFB_01134 [Mycobacterium simulans]|uniref:Uncharacterized protein n=1 Tax=Mycobacterium simulans TaxID=627089 RepID=A0A7Z7IJR5_9MYCO|nr:hypothetical protein MSIMFB_01134 [Mycobacterium simulans]